VKRGGIPHGDPVQLTRYLGADRNPCFSPDGGKIVFVSDRSGRPNLWILDLSTNKETPLTTGGGTEPCWSPTGGLILFTSFSADPGGHLALIDLQEKNAESVLPVTAGTVIDGQGKWSPDGKKIVFRRFADDTNDDGAVTVEDNGSIWQKSLDTGIDGSGVKESPGGGEIQITPESERAQNPCFGSEGRIYFDLQKEKGQDIWSIPEGGLFRRFPSAQEQYEAAWNRFGEATSPEPLAYSILGYRRVLDYFPGDSAWCSQALLRMGETYQVLSKPKQGRRNYELVRTRYANQKREAASAALKLAGFPDARYENRLSLCRAVALGFPEDPSIQAEAWILLGDLYRDARKTSESLASYGRVLQLPASRNWKAQAQLKTGDLFLFQGQGETAQQSYLAVLKEYGDIPIWRDRAGKRLLDQIRGSSQERISQYQQMIQQFFSMPSLIAEAQLAIAGELRNGGQFDQAFYELENMEALVPGLLWAHAKAKIMQAQLRSISGDDLKGIFLLENVIQNLGTVEGGRYAVEANDSLFSLLYRSAERLKNAGDVPLAVVRYKKALELRCDDVACHRGWVECLSRTDRIEEALKDYEERLKASPRDPVLLYGMGLALSYKGEKDAGLLKKSNDYLTLSLDENYRLVPPYRTMGFNYEALEKLEEKNKQRRRGFVTKAGGILLSPLRWAAGLIHLGRKPDNTGYYEKAIQVLSTALELNDEQTDPQMEARLAQNLANNFYNLGEYGYAKAFQYYRLRFSLDSTFANPLEKALLYERAGHTALFIQELEPASDFLNRAVLAYSDLGREEESLLSMRRLAMLNYQAQKYGDAVQVYQSLATRDEKANRMIELELDYRNIAFNNRLWGENEDALANATKAEQILKTWHIPEKPPKKDKVQIEIFGFSIPIPFIGVGEIGGALSEGFTLADEAAMVWGLISRSSEDLKRMDDAVAYEQKRLSLFRKRKDGFAERISLNRLGLLYYKSSRFSEAWTYFAMSREASKKKKNYDASGVFINTMNLANVAMVEMANQADESHFALAVQFLEEERGKSADRREKMMLSNALGAAWLLHAKGTGANPNPSSALAESVRRFADLARAETCFLESLKLAREEGDGRHEAAVLKNLAETNARAGDRDAAASYMRQSLEILESIQDRDWIWRVRAGLADLAGGQGPEDKSGINPEDLFEQAMSELEALPVQEAGSEELLSDRKERVDLYVHAAFHSADRGGALKALEIAERGRQKELADMLARRPPELKRERHKAAWGNLRDYRGSLLRLREQARTEKQEKKRTVLQDSLLKEEKKYEQILADIREEDPALAAAAGVLSIDLGAVRSILPADGGALVYLSGEDKTLIWFVDRDTVAVRETPFGAVELKRRAEALLSAILKDSSAVESCDAWYNILIRPVEALTFGKRSLVIVPDKAIWSVPFEALWSGTAYLSEGHEITYSPSLFATVLAWSRRRINFRNGILVGESRDEPLIGPIAELGGNAVSLLGTAATESALKAQAREADLIQIEKWIVPDPGQPFRSTLFLSPDSAEDGAIHASDLFQWDVKASLVLLPYAATKDPSAFQPDAFFYALCYAGVPTVGMTAWPVDRETKRSFEQSFYRTAKRLSFGSALQAAAGSVRKDKPGIRFWAGFRLIGFEGMGAEERIAFAEDNLSKTVLEARIYEQKEEYEDALASFEKALSMSEAVKDTASTVNLWKETVRIGMKGKLWNKAVAYQMKLIQHAERRGDSTSMLNGYRNLSAFCVQNGWFEAAAQAKSKVIDFLEKQGRPDLIPAQMEDLAFIHERDRKYGKAADFSQKAYEQYASQNNAPGAARALIRKGRFLLEADKIWAAKEALKTGIASLDSLAKSDNDTYELASGYSLLGLVCERLAQYDEGFRNQEKALSLFENLKRTTQAAQSNQYLANLYWKTGNYRMALSMQRKALDTFEALQNDKLLVMAYGTLGLIHSSLGDLVKAEEAEQKALDLTEKTNNQTDKGAILKNLGIIRIQQEKLDQAMALFTRAAAIDSTLGQQSGLASDFRNIGNLLVRMGRHRESVALFRRGIGVSDKVGEKRNAIQCFFGLGQAYDGLGDRKSAAAALDSGLAMALPLQLPDIVWRLYRQRGKLSEESGQNEAALQDYRNAAGVVEKQRAELKVSSFQQGFLDDKMDLYSDAVRLLCNTGQGDQAFDFVERAKSRNFIDMLGNRKSPSPRGQTHVLEPVQTARNLVQEAQDRLADLNRQTKDWAQKEKDERLYWETELEKRRKTYEDVLARIQSESPELASFVSVDPFPVKRIQALLPDSTALVEYYLSREEIFAWWMTSKTLMLSRVRASAADVENTVRRFREAIQSRLSSDRENQVLSEWLIAPLSKNLAGIRHLVFIPHGILHYLPFSALKDKNGRALIESFSMSLAPSATVLGYCMEKKGGRAPGDVLAVANPDLGDEKTDLPFAEREVQALKRTYRSVRSYSGPAATEAAVRSASESRYALVHFACHGEYQPETPLFSALLLSPDGKDDGRLEAQEIFDMRFDCGLVTLSACETGLAKITRGDEVVGLARGFLFAGAPSVITSLWKVDDLATAVLMKRFYRYLKQGDSRAGALRKAQVFVKESLNGHPSAWAAFHLTGDFR
jgi:CHAT domain-containing protein/Tfp pilus assembly protein PilF